jgi:hypothetical protein
MTASVIRRLSPRCLPSPIPREAGGSRWTNPQTLDRPWQPWPQPGLGFSQAEPVETSHHRPGHRPVSVDAAPPDWGRHWPRRKHLMRVQRGGTRPGQPFAETLGDLPNLEGHATQCIQPMQQPWTSAHRWLWVRDVGCGSETLAVTKIQLVRAARLQASGPSSLVF